MSAKKPPSRLPNGKENRAYRNWIFNIKSDEEKEAIRAKKRAYISKYNSSEKAKATRERYFQTDKGRAALERAAASNKLTRACIECGIRYLVEDVMAREYKLVGKFHCLCEHCL